MVISFSKGATNWSFYFHGAGWKGLVYLVVFHARVSVDMKLEVPLLIEAFPTDAAPEGIVILVNPLDVTSDKSCHTSLEMRTS